MFKLESYIAPLLMGYIDKYVKLKQEDFQLSLWGGDAVLNKLDLRLDEIEHALNIPITFKSGFIHELRIHVPWTKLGSEPVIITINTIECILKLRDSAADDETASTKSASSVRSASQVVKPKPRRQDVGEELPPGYLQSLVNRIVNNVNIVINNLILKFVEDDIVLSVNVKSAECYSVNSDWMRAFIELSVPELVLRRVINFHDLTICLDKRNASGKIEMYQDPLLYRCSLTCRIHMTFDGLHAKYPLVTKFNLLCEKLDLSLTDTQVPMFFRLMELMVALYYGTLDLPGPAPPTTDSESQPEGTRAEYAYPGIDEDDVDGQGWASWAWSYVPQILPTDEDEDFEDDQPRKNPEPAVLTLGFYVTKASVVFKLTELVQEYPYAGTPKCQFKPCMHWEAEGIGLDVLMRGLDFFSVQFGVTSTRIKNEGDAICGVKDVENSSRDPCFFRVGIKGEDNRQIVYTSNSLFDPGGAENQGDMATFLFDGEKHVEVYSENFAMQKFGAFWMDYLFTMDTQEEKQEGSRSSAGSHSEESVRENSAIRFVVGPAHLLLSSSMYQRVSKFIHCTGDHEYEPYSKPHKEIVDETRKPPTDEEVLALEEFVPTRSYHLTFLKPTVWCQAADLPSCDVTKKKMSVRKKSRRSKSRMSEVSSSPVPMLPVIVLQMERFDFQITSAMYPHRVVRTVSKMSTPSEGLLHHCHSHMYIKVFGVQAGVTCVDAVGSSTAIQNVIQPWSGAYYRKLLLLPMYWKNPLQPLVTYMYELPHFAVNCTKPQLMLLAHTALSWVEKTPQPAKFLTLSIMEDVFHISGSHRYSKQPVLEVIVTGLEVHECRTSAVWSAMGTLTSLQAMVVHSGSRGDSITPLLYGPLKTNEIPHLEFFTHQGSSSQDNLHEVVMFTIQMPLDANIPVAPAAVLVDAKGVVGCLDPILFEWLTYTPEVKSRVEIRDTRKSSGHQLAVDPILVESTSPLKNRRPSQDSHSGSTSTFPTDSQTPSATNTQTQSQSLRPTLPQTDTSGEHAEKETSALKSWGQKMAELFPLVKIMEMQVDIQNCCIFFPSCHIQLQEPSMNIADNMRAAFLAGTLPNTLVACCPAVHLASAGHKPLSALQDVPIKALEQSVAGEKLPWAVELSHGSVYTIHSPKHLHYSLNPLSLSATIAVTTKYQPVTSDNISMLGLCIHVDMDAVTMVSSKEQVQLMFDLCMGYIRVTRKLISSVKILRDMVSSSPFLESEPVLSHVTPARTMPRVASSSSQLEPPDMMLTVTETSETWSHDMSPNKDVEGSEDVKLSLWIQGTLPKLILRLQETDTQANEFCLCTELEDVTSSVDLQDVYSKVKMKIGSFNISHFHRKSPDEPWETGDHEGILMSCTEQLNRNVQIVSNKLWANHNQTSSNLFGSGELKPRDKSHSFLTMTLTRALRKNVKKRLRKINGDMGGMMNECEKKEAEAPERGMIYLNEVCVNVLPCDLILNGPALASALNVMSLNFGTASSPQTAILDDLDFGDNEMYSIKSESTKSSMKPRNPLPFLTSHILPLIYVNATNTRIFVPKFSTVSEFDGVSNQKDMGMASKAIFVPKDSSRKLGYRSANLQHDVCMLQISAISLTPQADNPLPRNVVDKEVYRRALHAGITHHPGSEVEDRQYQLDIGGLSLGTGCWSDLAKTGIKDSKTTVESVPVQNPALEWNNLLAEQCSQDDVKMIPIASSFDLRIVAAPAIVYHPTATDPLSRESVVVCGYSLEVNATTDIDFYLSTAQGQLLLEIYNTNLNALLVPSHPASIQSDVSSTVEPNIVHIPGQDLWSNVKSGPSSMTPIKENIPVHYDIDSLAGNSSPSSIGVEFTPFDVLLTAGKISFMVYAHMIESPVKLGLGGQGPGGIEVPGLVRHAHSKGDLEWRVEVIGHESIDSGMGTLSKSTSSASVNAALQEGTETLIRLAPFFYAHFSQPHTLMTCHMNSQKVELSCYDIVLKGAKPGYVTLEEGKLIPDTSDFTAHWIETRPGKPNPKTGIPPSLYTLRITDFLHQTAVAKLKIERPLKLNASLGKVEQAMFFLKEFSDGIKDAQQMGEESDSTGDKSNSTQPPPLSLLKTLNKLDSVHLVTVQVVVSMETVPCTEAPTLQLSTSSLDGCMSFRVGSQGYVDEITQNVCINDFLGKTTYMGKSQLLIGPVTGNLTVNSQWCEHSGPSHLPSILCNLDCGNVQIFIGQEHVFCLQMMGSHLQEYLKHSAETMEKEMSTPSKGRFTEKKNISPSAVGWTPVQHSEDDLRAGAFEYVAEDVGTSHMMPSTHEILFNSDLEEGHATLTWCYPEARSVTSLQVTPVPLTITQSSYANYIDENLKVPCVLQYWNVLTREWVDYGEFAVSEHESCHLHLPEVTTSRYNSEVGMAQVWRVEILHPRDKEDYAHYAYGPDDSLEPLVSALTLAASIRVDSCFAPCLIPIVQGCISASVVQVRLANHLQFLGKETPDKLQPFSIDCVSANNQEVALVTLDSPILTMSHLAGQHFRFDMGASATVRFDVLEFRNLTLQPVLDPFDVDMEGSWQRGNEQPSLTVQVLVDPVEIHVGASTIHTLHGTSEAWCQLLQKKPRERIVMQYYVICNNTLQNIRIGQAGTDECVQVVSQQAHPYSWRTHKARQELQLSLEGCGGLWTDPLDIDKDGTYVRILENQGQRSTLIIKVKELTCVQKQVVISGQVLVASRLTQHLEVKLLTDSGIAKESLARDPLNRDMGIRDSAPVMLGAQQDAPSFVVEHCNVRALKVRLLGIKTVWSQEIPITGEKMKESRLIKIPLHDKGSYIHVWCHVFCQHYKQDYGATQNLVMFLPLFLVRTHLPCPLLMNIETLRLKSSQQLELQGQGHEQHLHMMGGDMTHNITFQLSRRMPVSSPPISLSSGLIEQVPRQTLENLELEMLLSQWQGDLASRWPYNHTELVGKEQPRPVPAPKQDIVVPHQPMSLVPSVDTLNDQPDIDLQITLSQRWPGCNTVLIDIAPHWLFVNETNIDLLVIESNNQQWRLPRQKAFAPPVFQGAFQLGLVHNGRITSSSVVTLSEGDNLNRYLPEVDGVLYKYGHVTVKVRLVNTATSGNQICYLSLHSTEEESIRIISIRECYRIDNNTPWDLDVQCFSLPLSQNKVTLDHKTANTSAVIGTKADNTGSSCYLPYWSLPAKTQTDVGSEDTDYVQYLCLRLCSNEHAVKSSPAPVNVGDLMWSVPYRIRSVEDGSRISVAIPAIDPDGLFRTESCVLTSQLYRGMTYLGLLPETGPNLELHNNCGFPLHYGQALVGISVEGATVQEEVELTTHLPILPPGGSACYSFPSCNSDFPEISTQTVYPKIHFASCQIEHSNIAWSNGVDVSVNLDIFVNIPNESDTKVHIEKISHTIHVFIDPVSRAEISAKEIRSRIKGRETTVVVETARQKKSSPDKLKESSRSQEYTRQDSVNNKEKTFEVYRPLKIDIAVLCKSASLSVVDDCSSMAVISEVVRMTGDNICIFYCSKQPRDPFFIHPHVMSKVTLCVGDLQVDNQMHGRGNYDFPVVFVRQGPPDFLDLDVDFVKMSTEQKISTLREKCILTVDGNLCCDLVSRFTNLQNLEFNAKAISIFMEDTFLYDAVKRVVKFIPSKLSCGDKPCDKKPIRKHPIPLQVQFVSAALSRPIRLDRMVIQPLRLLLSVHASLKLFIASDNAPLSFAKFERKGILTTTQQLVRVVFMHYASSALFRAGLVVGSLEILGNPTGLVRSIGNGVSDLFRMPYEGLYRGPGAFIGGVTGGMASLFKHVSTGTLNSITNFASSVSRNMDRLSLDSEHKERQDLSRRHKPTGLSEGLKLGLAGFGMSLLGAVAGIADQPLQSLTQPSSTERPTSTSQRATGIVSGVGKGLVGAVTKPIGGAAEFVSQTGMGLLQGVGLGNFPRPRHEPVLVTRETRPNGNLKYMQKMLHTVPNVDMLVALDASWVDFRGQGQKVILLLTPEILFLVNHTEDAQQQAFAVSEIDCCAGSRSPDQLHILMRDPEIKSQTWQQDQNHSKERVAEFIDGATSYIRPFKRESCSQDGQSDSSSQRSAPVGSKRYEFQVEAKSRQLFLAMFHTAKAKATGSGFPL